ncbi:arginyltransferase [Agitococcus lubricus]|uniref:Aspartate/glutamate leucyltransferase n=1 Tax=Agitococcus lubricus TaxID=1077255 RepID=A0A2T5IZV3_9GAMM|nr:arginyltransferase [Agitococcus lubricus]PTQ89514.1 arginine-tRNA-protein transferase [Agitococcus lubricus]
MTASSGLKFFSTPPHHCSYLEDEQAITLFADPEASITNATYHQLSLYGFRRSGNYIYKPQCASCHACVSVRIPVAAFAANRQQRRVWQRNQDLTVRKVPATYVQAHYDLYAKYIRYRHADGDMFPPSVAQYVSFLFADWSETWLYEFYDGFKLIAVAVCDVLKNGLSAVYTFYDTDAEKRSLGTYAVLWQIAEAQKMDLSFLYLGYWVKNSPKMAYKTNFRPLEALIDQLWRPLNNSV